MGKNKENKETKRESFNAIIFVIGVMLVFAGIFFMIKDTKKLDGRQRAIGWVTKVYDRQMTTTNEVKTYYEITYPVMIDIPDRTYIREKTRKDNYVVGDELELYYNKNNYQDVIEYTGMTVWFIWLYIIGGSFMAYSLILSSRHSNKKQQRMLTKKVEILEKRNFKINQDVVKNVAEETREREKEKEKLVTEIKEEKSILKQKIEENKNKTINTGALNDDYNVKSFHQMTTNNKGE